MYRPIATSHPNAFSRRRRLTDSAQYKAVFGAPYRSIDRHFVVLGRRTASAKGVRLGLAISRRCARRAVDRNRLKRLVRESFRCRAWPDCPLNLVVLCRAAAVPETNQTLLQSLDDHWRRIETHLCAGC